jgi:bacteriocin-like protein
MPKITKTDPKKTAPKGPGAAQKIRQGKAELSDDELKKVSGGQTTKKSFIVD